MLGVNPIGSSSFLKKSIFLRPVSKKKIYGYLKQKKAIRQK